MATWLNCDMWCFPSKIFPKINRIISNNVWICTNFNKFVLCFNIILVFTSSLFMNRMRKTRGNNSLFCILRNRQIWIRNIIYDSKFLKHPKKLQISEMKRAQIAFPKEEYAIEFILILQSAYLEGNMISTQYSNDPGFELEIKVFYFNWILRSSHGFYADYILMLKRIKLGRMSIGNFGFQNMIDCMVVLSKH